MSIDENRLVTEGKEKLLPFKKDYKKYFDDKVKEFFPAILSDDLRSFLHIVTLKDNPKEIYIYNPKTGLYGGLGSATLTAKIKFILGPSYLEHYARAVINDIRACTHILRDDFVVPIQFVAMQNGIVDVSKYPVELIDYSPKFYFIRKSPTIYNPKAKCPAFFKFLNEILPEDKFRLQIQEMFGWCLRHDYIYQYVFLLIGDGSNGKGKLLNTLEIMLGKKNVVAISLQRLCNNRFIAGHLWKKSANILSEMPTQKIADSTLFKQATGEDIITTEVKGGRFFEFYNFAKLIFSANAVPYCADKTFAYYRRWVLIFFHVRFGDGGLKKDVHVLDKLTTPEELSGIFNWSLEGLHRLNKNEDFTERMSVPETQEYYERLVSPISAFLDENITEAGEEEVNYIPKDYLFNKIEDYIKEKQLLNRDVTKKKIAYIIRKRYTYIESKQQKVAGKPRTHVWKNCKFVDGSDLKIAFHSYLDTFKDSEESEPSGMFE